MSDYIEREKAKDAVLNIVGWEKIAKYVDEMSKHPSTKDIDYYDALLDAEDVIDDLPPADVAPVRHGHWYFYDGKWYCSVCGYCMEWCLSKPIEDWCGSYGARMDAKE